MAKCLVHLLLILVCTSVRAECSLNLSYGKGNVLNIPTDHIEDALTTNYTRVTTRTDGSSNVNEIGLECEVANDFFISVSHLEGLQASASHDVFFRGLTLGTVTLPGVDLSGISFPGAQTPWVTVPPFTLPIIPPRDVDLSGVEVPEFKLAEIHERASAQAWRVSVAKYFEAGSIDPYVRLGVEHARAVHQGVVPVTDTVAIRYRKSLEVTAPYIGLGATYNRGRAVSFRAGAELLSLGPHYIWTWSIGVDVPIRFGK
jgi:hypothetical protein